MAPPSAMSCRSLREDNLNTIYLDNNATTSCSPEVVAAMAPYWNENFGNAASSLHSYGWQAKGAVSQCKTQLADLLGGRARDFIFTSGATESIQLFLFGLVETLFRKHKRPVKVITTPIEHKAVLKSLEKLAQLGWADIIHAKLHSTYELDLTELKNTLLEHPDTQLIAAMWVNNELGTINDIGGVAALCEEKGIYFFCDGTQGVGKLPLDLSKIKIHGLALSAHKLHGPKGIGALYVPEYLAQELQTWSFGGGQDQGLRSGTQAVPLIVGMTKAIEISVKNQAQHWWLTQRLGELFLEVLKSHKVDFRINGPKYPSASAEAAQPLRSVYVLNLTFPGQPIDLKLGKLGRLAFSTGSACHGQDTNMSHVLQAINFTEEEASSTIRFSISYDIPEDQIREAAKIVAAAFGPAKQTLATT